MKLTILGTASGGLAVAERQHTAFAVEVNDALYWIDAGEGCARTAHLTGIDLLRTRCIFITHVAMDHVGGLPPLLWTIRKLNRKTLGEALANRILRAFVPHAPMWYGIVEMLEATTQNRFARDFVFKISEYRDGMVYKDNNLALSASHNSHLGRPTDCHGWRSYGLRVTAGDASLVYTGDVERVAEIDELLHEPCDLLLADASHIEVPELCTHIRDRGLTVKRLALVHLGRVVLDDMEAARQTVRQILGHEPLIPDDGTQVEL